jgi:choline dehydrogenase
MQNGKVLGGGSSVNAMVNIRGARADYDDWAKSTGINDLNGDQMFRIMSELENNAVFGGPAHGTNGPLHVSNQTQIDALSQAFVTAAQNAGFPYNPDFNSGDQNGVGFYQLNTRGNRRWSAVDAFLRPLMRNPNLKIETEALVERVVFDGKTAKGVVYRKGDRTIEVHSARSVVLCAGAIASPKLLMQSGIGDAEALRSLGIEVLHDNPNVGEHLIDHCEAPIAAYTKKHMGYFGVDTGWRSWLAGIQYLAFGTGPAASNGVESGGFMSTTGDADRPDIQIFSVPGIYLDKDIKDVAPGPGLTINACLLHPKSRGSVRLSSRDAQALPKIRTGFLSDEADLDTLVSALERLRTIFDHEPLKGLIREEALPGSAVRDREAFKEHIRRFAKTVYHPMGTCRLGALEDVNSVLEPDFSVKGVVGLKVVDASSFPGPVSGNTCFAVYALAKLATACL